eukprot:2077747-Rhodomonas_salina.1
MVSASCGRQRGGDTCFLFHAKVPASRVNVNAHGELADLNAMGASNPTPGGVTCSGAAEVWDCDTSGSGPAGN